MRISTTLLLLGSLLAVVPSASAQRTNRGSATKSSGSNSLVTRMMEFDADKNGKLTKEEVTDERLLGLFDRADTNQDGALSKTELTNFAAKNRTNTRNGRAGDIGGPGGPGGFGGPGGPGGARPKPGEVLPERVQERLKLTADQKAQLKELQKEVNAKLAKILTSEQTSQLAEMAPRGPGGPGGFGGPGGPDGGRRGPGMRGGEAPGDFDGPAGGGFDQENAPFPGPQF